MKKKKKDCWFPGHCASISRKSNGWERQSDALQYKDSWQESVHVHSRVIKWVHLLLSASYLRLCLQGRHLIDYEWINLPWVTDFRSSSSQDIFPMAYQNLERGWKCLQPRLCCCNFHLDDFHFLAQGIITYQAICDTQHHMNVLWLPNVSCPVTVDLDF